MKRLLWIGIVVALLVPVTANAQAPFFWMADVSPDRKIGGELMFINTEAFGLNAGVIAGQVNGDYSFSPDTKMVFRVPFAWASFDVGPNEESGFGLGNLSLGVINSRLFSQRGSKRLYLGGGFRASLPTAEDDGDNGTTAVVLATDSLVPDMGRYAVNTTTFRLHGDARWELDTLFFQVELALDLFFVDDAPNPELVNLGLGGGVVVAPRMAIVAELTTLSDMLEDNYFGDDDFVHSLDLGFRYQGGSFLMGARLYMALDEIYRDDDVVGVGVDVANRF